MRVLGPERLDIFSETEGLRYTLQGDVYIQLAMFKNLCKPIVLSDTCEAHRLSAMIGRLHSICATDMAQGVDSIAPLELRVARDILNATSAATA